MSIRKIIGKIHLLIGLPSGLLIFIIAITGCIYAFKTEIENATQNFRFVESEDRPLLPPSELQAIAERELPGKEIHAVLYHEPGKAAQVIFYHAEPEYYYFNIFINPYSGKVLHVQDMDKDFFQFILDGHFYLWLPHQIGQKVVSIVTLVFISMLLTGIVLWWPRGNNQTKNRLTIKFDARWRRKNYDLHSVLGFYASWIAIILAITGLVWGFTWVADGLHKIAGGDKSLVYYEPPSDTTAIQATDIPAIDRVYYKLLQEYPKGTILEVHIPHNSASPVSVNANPDPETYWQRDFRYFDQYTLREMPVDHVYGRIDEASIADKLLRMNYDIHTGAILGTPGKVLVFLASLLVASLPVTGVCIWWGRRHKSSLALRKGGERSPAEAAHAVSLPGSRP